MKKNCINCRHLEWGFGDVGDPEGWVCEKRDYYKSSNHEKAESHHLFQLDSKKYREKSKVCCDLELIDEHGRFCFDRKGNKVRAGDFVSYFDIIGKRLKVETGNAKVKCIGDMNEKQINMPYLVGKGAWHPMAIEKIISR